jgi:hypothetical protein
MRLFKTREERQAQDARKEEQLRQKEQHQADLEARMAKIELFPGNLAEYNTLKGEEYEIIDLHRQVQFIYGDKEHMLNRLVEFGADAAIHYNIISLWTVPPDYSGVPVRRKQTS